MTGNISAKADKAAAKKPKKVSKYSKRKVDPAFYWMRIRLRWRRRRRAPRARP